MIKYLVGAGVLVIAAVAYFLMTPAQEQPAPPPAAVSEPTPPAPLSPAEPVPDTPTADSLTGDALLEQSAADLREDLPEAVTDTLTLTDALFLPRMRIMELSYVTVDADPQAATSNLRALITDRTEAICRDNRTLFEMGVTLRNTFSDNAGAMLQRIYLLPEDCQPFF